jgi:RHS repeat-associated protein
VTQDPPDHQQLTELNWSNGVSTPGYTNVRVGGQLIAHYDLSGSQPALYFHFGDWLGTLRVITDAAGNVSPNGQTCIGLPYGNGEYCTPTQSTNYLFAGKERDPETNGPNGNDYFGARYYASTMGQFLTPDWSVKAEPVPYAKVDNPQSLNLYRYVFDNPLTGVDLDGHEDQVPSSETESLASDFCTTQVASNNFANCLHNALMTPGAGGESFAAFQAKLNQKQQAGTHSQDLCKGNPNCVVVPAGPNCAMDVTCRLEYGATFGAGRQLGLQAARGFSAPNNPAQPNPNCGQILWKAAPTVGLDAAGVVAGAIPGSGAALVTTQVAVGLAGAANAAYHGDVGGTLAGTIAGAQLAPIAAVASQVGWQGVARALPAFGSVVSAYYFYKDATSAIDKYQACEAGIGG